ncbi:thioredoxin [Lingula anatina]|uniref:Thioredoxin n=1 Tax=Lingula anatina TaxID=7574 RepID=A0A1S3K3E5_LINAN|nr:thioredoxin [Lingula anatina]|eukprot:XP_013417153.1 thioredoxin [Lingula anatina]
MLIEIECESQLMDIIKSSGNTLVVVDFYATWCGPCRVIGPFLEKLEQEFPHVKFVKVDVDEYGEFAEQEGIEVMPTLYFYKKGKKVDEMAGANRDKLRELVTKYAAGK